MFRLLKSKQLCTVVKQRLQMHNSTSRTVAETFRNIYRTEGLSALWVSYPTTLSVSLLV